jgi:hypothetical protein
MIDSSDPDDIFSVFWWNELTPNQRKSRIEDAFVPIRTVGRKQMSLLDTHSKSSAEKDIGFLFFVTTVRNTWNNVDFAIELGKGRHRRFSFYPTRTVLESLLHLEHYCGQKKDGQNDIALREMLRIAKRFYDREMVENQTGEPYKTWYEEIAGEGKYPTIDKANSSDNPFPKIKKLADESPVYKGAHLYFSYQALCELAHGKMLAITASRQDELAEHTRSLMELFSLSCNLIKLVDLHIQGATNEDVTKALHESEAITKKGMR